MVDGAATGAYGLAAAAGEATQLDIVLEESAKLLGVVSFLLGHLAVFASVLAGLPVAVVSPARFREPSV